MIGRDGIKKKIIHCYGLLVSYMVVKNKDSVQKHINRAQACCGLNHLSQNSDSICSLTILLAFSLEGHSPASQHPS